MPSGTQYGDWGSAFSVTGSNIKRQIRTVLKWSYTEYPTYVDVWFQAGVEINYGFGEVKSSSLYLNVDGNNQGAVTTKWKFNDGKGYTIWGNTYSRRYEKWSYARSVSVTTFYVKSSGNGSGTYRTSRSIPVPALKRRIISFDSQGGSACGSVTKYYGGTVSLPTPSRSEHSFLGWNTNASGSGKMYYGSYADNPSGDDRVTLYAIWQALYPPTCDVGELKDNAGFSQYTKGHSEVSVDISNILLHKDGRTIKSVTMYLTNGNTVVKSNVLTSDGTLTAIPPYAGTWHVTVEVEDNETKTVYDLGYITVVDPTYTRIATFENVNPDVTDSGNARATIEAYNYVDGRWETLNGNYEVTDVSDAEWTVTMILEDKYVQNGNTSRIRATYNHTETEETSTRSAFFNTTRNAYFGSGLANTIFVSGCDEPNFSSRVWWSYANNPLYFPDTYYAEVGSNDTAVMGMCKVGNYLGVVKQSKTTDTAIFLLYPTSFENDTTYAVKQGIQGVGALSKYTFNVLGDETLFLSPNGVVAVVPSEDDEHKVQNRSFFVDGKMLKEPNMSEAYSFVHEGKYYLAFGDGCYVLDGNQRNSWGNDKTNLVYECYYLDNIPASCFMKYTNTYTRKEELWFSNSEAVCRFKSIDDYEPFIDDGLSGDETKAVEAEWSTLFDDDGSLHYAKTTEKKGTVVSLLPQSNTKGVVDIYVKTDKAEAKVGTAEVEGELPVEFYPNKKFKKYKRLQFILRCYEGGFGIDSIIKPYTLGNYSKNIRKKTTDKNADDGFITVDVDDLLGG